MSDTPGERRATSLIIITAAAVLRLVFAAIISLPPDEAYYWEWSRHLAGGYFDHPPVVALLIRAGTAVLGDNRLGVRLGAVVAGWFASLCLVRLAHRHGGEAAACRAAVFLSCMPLAAAGLVLATPDAPLLLAVAFTLLALDHALAEDPGSARAWRWWLIAGAAIGAGGASKYNAILIPAAVVLALITHRDGRRHLATPAPYVAVVVALCVVSPVIVWNAHHDWASFRFQLEHGTQAARGTPLQHELDLLGGQMALVSPVLFVLLAIAVARGLRTDAVRERTLAVVAAFVFLFFCVTSWTRTAEANWQAPAYTAAIALLALMPGGRAWRRWTVAAVTLGALMSGAIYLQTVVPFLPISANDDPTARGTGWRTLAAAMDSMAVAPRAAGHRVWLGGDRYQEASEIAFHDPSHPETFSLNLNGRPNQYDFWPRFPARAHTGDDLLLALEIQTADSVDRVIEILRPHFTAATLRATVDLDRGREVRTRRHVWLLEGWRGTWPVVGSTR